MLTSAQSSGVTLHEDAYATFQQIKTGKTFRFVTFGLSDNKENIVVKGTFGRDKGYADFVAQLKAVCVCDSHQHMASCLPEPRSVHRLRL